MTRETDNANSKPDNPSESKIPLHYRLAENLIINEIAGKMPEIHMPAVFWSIKKRLLRKFIGEYFEKHKELPSGSHDVGKMENCSLFNGVIDFDVVKQNIYEDLKRKDGLNFQTWKEGGVRSDIKSTRKIRM